MSVERNRRLFIHQTASNRNEGRRKSMEKRSSRMRIVFTQQNTTSCRPFGMMFSLFI